MHRLHQAPWVALAVAPVLVASCSGGPNTPTISSNRPSPIPDIALVVIATGLTKPVHIASAGGGSGRLYVVEQAGVVRIIENGTLLVTPFLDISAKVENEDEKGLLSIAFHPAHSTNGEFFLNYTTRPGGPATQLFTNVTRMRRGAGGLADLATEQLVLQIAQPFDNHNGGQLAFGPDGYLYIGMGDGGSANDPNGHGQDRTTLLGDLLRIDVDGGMPYTIPPDNPFVGMPPLRGDIYAFGFRNPWRFSFDALTGLLYLADVGQSQREEIDVVETGKNYGWRIMEGDICTPPAVTCDMTGLELPIWTYGHSDGQSITGGFVYRGSRFPDLRGTYLYADYVSGRVWGLQYDGRRVTAQRLLLNSGITVSSFGQGDDLELYVADHQGGRILQVTVP